MEFHAPGADIVGFEHPASSEADHAAIDAAIAKLAQPLALFTLPAAAECAVTAASAALEGEDMHDDEHEHEEDHGDEHEEDHADEDDHADEHGEDHDEDHEDEARHTEFHAEYALTCANPAALSEITFGYFDTFENARELEVQVLTASGAKAFEVMREAPTLDLSGAL